MLFAACLVGLAWQGAAPPELRPGVALDLEFASEAARKQTLRYSVDAAATPYVWVEARGVPVGCRVTWLDQAGGNLELPGRPTTWAHGREVPAGTSVGVTVAPASPESGGVRIHFDLARETTQTQAAVEHGRAALAEATRLHADGHDEDATALLSGYLAELRDVSGALSSRRVNDLLWSIGEHALVQHESRLRTEVWSLVVPFAERYLPEAHADVQLARENLALALLAAGRANEARRLLERVLEVAAAAAPESVEHNRARINLASALGTLGEVEARIHQLECADVSLADGGVTERDSRMGVRKALMSALNRAGRHDEARDYESPPVEAPYSESAIVERIRATMQEAAQLAKAGNKPGAAALVRDATDELLELTARQPRESWLGLLKQLAGASQAYDDLETCVRACERVAAALADLLPSDAFELHQARMSLAAAHANHGDRATALTLFRDVIAAFERILADDDDHLLVALEQIGYLQRATRDLAGAQATFERALARRERTLPPDHARVLAARQQLFLVLWQSAQHERAHALSELNLAVLERTLPEGHARLQSMRGEVANLAFNAGDLDRAKAVGERILAVWLQSKPDDDDLVQRARSDLADTLGGMGESRAALELRRKVVAVLGSKLADDDPRLLDAQSDLAYALDASGDVAAANRLQRHVVETQARFLADTDARLRKSRLGLALSSSDLGDLTGARALFDKILANPEAPDAAGFDFTLARANYASLLYHLGELEAARALYQQVGEQFERTLYPDHQFCQKTHACLARISFDMGDIAAARAAQERVVAAFERTRRPGDYELDWARHNLAMMLRAQGESVQALALATQVVASLECSLPDEDGYLQRARRNLALTQAQVGDLAGLETTVEGVWRGLHSCAQRGRTWSIRERQELAHTSRDDSSTLLSLVDYLRADAPLRERAFDAVESLRDLAASASTWRELPRDAPIATKLVRAREVRAALAGMVLDATTIGGTQRASAAALAALSRERDRLEQELADYAEQHGLQGRPLDVASVAHALPPDACAVAYTRYTRTVLDAGALYGLRAEEALLAHVVTADERLAAIELGPLERVSRAVTAWRAAIGAPLGAGEHAEPAAAEEVERAGVELRRLVLDPVFAAAGGAKRLHACLDDALYLVPLDALPFDDGALVGERRSIVVEVSLGRLVNPRAPSRIEAQLVALGGASFDSDLDAGAASIVEASAPWLASARGGGPGTQWRPLPQTLEEVAALAELFSRAHRREPVQLVGADATKLALHAHAASARFLHVATHGYFAPDSLRSSADRPASNPSWQPMQLDAAARGLAPMTLCGLALAGANRGPDESGRVQGVITAEELAALDLSGCELAVLAACDSNVGIQRAGQSMQSLQAALQIAGARTVVTSSWRIDDRAAKELMLDFYERVWSRGTPKARALWEAKMVLRDKRYAVRDWAGWVLTGDPD